MRLTSKRYTVDDALDAQELFHSRGWSDGLAVVPPTPAAVKACLDWVRMPPERLVGIESVRARTITCRFVPTLGSCR